jgi:hypothetical protein
MRRLIPLVVVIGFYMVATGCGGLGWYRAAGDFPGIAFSDYAFTYFRGTSSQVFQYPVHQVAGSAAEAMADLGFTAIRGEPSPDGSLLIHAHAPDGRPTEVVLTPRNRMTDMKVTIGPAHLGDQMFSLDLMRRVALNFGTLPRDYTPIEPTLAVRGNPFRGVPRGPEPPIPEVLEGEGLRPDQTQSRTLQPLESDSETSPSTTPPNSIRSVLPPGFIYTPTQDNPNPPIYPYAPFPYVPPNPVNP